MKRIFATAIVAAVIGGASGYVGASGPMFYGSGVFTFTPCGVNNAASPPNNCQWNIADLVKQVTFHASGGAGSGYLASAGGDTAQGPNLVFHKYRGTVNAQAAIRDRDIIGRIAYKAAADSSYNQYNVGFIDILSAAPDPSTTDLQTRFRIMLTPPLANEPAEWLGGDFERGLTLAGVSIVSPERHQMLRAYTMEEIKTLDRRPAYQTIAVKDDPSGRRIAISDGRYWRFADGKVVP